MSISEWRKSKTRVKAARELMDSETFRQMLEVLRDSNPLYYQSKAMPFGQGVTQQDHSRMLGQVEGYHLCMDVLASLGAAPPRPVTEILPTYNQPEII